MRSVLVGLATLGFLQAVAPLAFALDPGKALTQYPQKVWRTDDGLPQNNVHAIVRDRQGYMWLGTESGLARFDGVRFVPFLTSNTLGIPNNSIWAMLADSRGDIWAGTEGGLTRRRDSRFTAYTTADGLPSNVIHALHEDPQGTVWAGTAGGLARLDGARFTAASGPGAPVNERVRALASGKAGDLWAGTEHGLFRLQSGRWRRYTTQDGLGFDIVYALHEDRQGRLWIATYGGGVSVLEAGRFKTFTTAEGLGHLFVYSLHEDRDGNMWAGTQAGLSRWRDGRFETITPREGLASGHIWTFHEDAEGSLWMGARGGGGLIRLSDGAFVTFGAPEGLLGENIYSAWEDRDGNAWVAMLGAGVARIGRDGQVRNFTGKDGLVRHDRIWTVYVDARGTTWAGGDAGLFELRGERFESRPGIVNIRALVEDREGTLWIGTTGEGLGRRAGGRLSVLHTSDGLPNDSPTALFVDGDGALWAGTWGAGVARIENGKVARTYTTRDGLASDTIKVITQDRRGDYWFGTAGGLSRLSAGRLTSFSRKDGLYDDTIFQVFDDAAGFLWLGSPRGVFRIRRQDLDGSRGTADLPAAIYGTADGLRVGACTGLGTPAGFRGSDGRLWFTTPRGLSVVNPAHGAAAAWKPPVVVEELVVNGQAVDVREGVSLSGGVRDLEIRYTALSLTAPARVRFRSWLEGFEGGWRDVGERRSAYYTNLSPGRYRFKAAADSADGVWTDSVAELAFSVEPLYYQTRWFAALVVLALAAAGLGTHRLRVRHLRAREALLARRVEEEMGKVKLLSGLLPICASCKKIRDDRGYWNQIELYIHEHTEAEFSHSICPECAEKLYPGYAQKIAARNRPGGP